ncbi:MAG: aldo/keto reductase [Halolamina sp.]
MATSSGTWGYRDRFGDSFGRTYFRRFGPGVVSSVGLGTYLGAPTDAVDERYREAVTTALEAGVNLVDTAVNYRCQRSERVVGSALAAAETPRESVVVATKGGFLPFDGERPADPAGYVRERFLAEGLIAADQLARGSHCIAPEYLRWSVGRSRENLGVDALDLFYVHNPETQLAERSRAAVYDQLEAAFVELERRVAAGHVGRYGVATWDAFRVGPAADDHLDLAVVLGRARRAAAEVSAGPDPGPDGHHLAAIQLPFNAEMADAFTAAVHRPPAAVADDGSVADVADDERVSALEFAHEAGLSAFASASLLQGDLAVGVPDHVAARVAGDTAAQRAVNFARSGPAVTAALVGARDSAHVAEDVAAGTFDPMGASAFDEVFE